MARASQFSRPPAIFSFHGDTKTEAGTNQAGSRTFRLRGGQRRAFAGALLGWPRFRPAGAELARDTEPRRGRGHDRRQLRMRRFARTRTLDGVARVADSQLRVPASRRAAASRLATLQAGWRRARRACRTPTAIHGDRPDATCVMADVAESPRRFREGLVLARTRNLPVRSRCFGTGPVRRNPMSRACCASTLDSPTRPRSRLHQAVTYADRESSTALFLWPGRVSPSAPRRRGTRTFRCYP
jgi:hypothetical protein